jgi:hypothetical protein
MCTAEICVTADSIAVMAKLCRREQRNFYLDLHVNYRIIYHILKKTKCHILRSPSSTSRADTCGHDDANMLHLHHEDKAQWGSSYSEFRP